MRKHVGKINEDFTGSHHMHKELEGTCIIIDKKYALSGHITGISGENTNNPIISKNIK